MVKRYFDHMIPTDCYALCALAILKTFEIRPIRATFSCFTGPKVILFHASMKKYDLLTLVSKHLIKKRVSKSVT